MRPRDGLAPTIALLDTLPAEQRPGVLARVFGGTAPAGAAGDLQSFFSDTLGYRFVSRLEPPLLRSDLNQYISQGELGASMAAVREGGAVRATIQVNLAEGWHCYAPSSTDGIPLQLVFAHDSPFSPASPPVFPESADGHLAGRFAITQELVGEGDVVEVVLRYQVCDLAVCLPPAELRLAAAVFTAE